MKALFFLYLFYFPFPPAGENRASYFQDNGGPPRDYIRTLMKEADAAVRVKIRRITLDSCTDCTSTGRMYIIEGDVLKKYFDKKNRITHSRIIYISAADTALYAKKDNIVFLHKIKGQDVEQFKKVGWTARQATEFGYNRRTESIILSQSKKHG